MERTNIVNNSTPLNRFTGIEDFPAPSVPKSEPKYPIHAPLIPLFAKKGTTKKIIPSSAERMGVYGDETFDENSIYFNEYTWLSNILIGTGNVHPTIRIKPSDAPAPANVTVYLDVLATKVPLYKRNSDGGYKVDALGDKEFDTEVDGFRVKCFAGYSPEGMKLGEQKILEGTMVDAVDPTIKSKLIPIYDMAAAEFGSFYSNIGHKISPIVGTKLQSRFKTDAKFLPYEFMLFERANERSSGIVKKTLTQSVSTTVGFTKDAKHPYTDGLIAADLLIPHNWYNENPSAPTVKYYELDNMHIYYENLDNLLKQFLATEKHFIKATKEMWEDGVEASSMDWFDFANLSLIDEEQHLINWVTLKSSSKQINYFTLIKDDSVTVAPTNMEEVTIGSDSIIYLKGGGDGTISNEELERWIDETMNLYLDPDSSVQSLAINKETGMYDVGFPLETKKKFGKMLAVRPDTIVHLCTHQMEYGDTPMTLDEEYQTAIGLMAGIELYPESELYGTSVARATVALGSMTRANSTSKRRYTQNFDLALIFSRYLGASERRMNPNFALDDGRKNTILTLGKDYTPYEIPDSFKQVLWGGGLTYSEMYNTIQRAYLAIKTVHNNEQSILTNPVTLYLNAVVCRIMDDAHRTFAGNSSLTDEVFANKFIKYMEKQLVGVIDNGRYEVTFKVDFLAPEVDGKRYAYKVYSDIRGRVMRTAQVSSVRTFTL